MRSIDNRIRLMLLRAACCITLLLLSICTAAEERRKWPEGSAMATGSEYKKNRDYFSDLVEKKQIELITLVKANSTHKIGGERLLKGLTSLHEAWKDYYQNECELIGALSGAGGSWPSTYALRCEAILMHRRFLTLTNP
ncbi:hypothetical protein [Hahella sp. NBU794]|uniref:hypothetical protein n=1 Tax=Hahella sp. NBU794 TaxID=3422590 RepID=UPI003D6E308C